MFTLPNFISLVRIPLALAFLQDDTALRAAALVLAMITDCLDGFLARRYQSTSRFGTFLDPLADKIFVISVLIVMVGELKLQSWEAVTMLCRDFAVIIFGFYLVWKGTLAEYQFRSIWFGKITTALQLVVLLGLTLGITFPSILYISFIILGLMALGELYIERKRLRVEEN